MVFYFRILLTCFFMFCKVANLVQFRLILTSIVLISYFLFFTVNLVLTFSSFPLFSFSISCSYSFSHLSLFYSIQFPFHILFFTLPRIIKFTVITPFPFSVSFVIPFISRSAVVGSGRLGDRGRGSNTTVESYMTRDLGNRCICTIVYIHLRFG